MIVDTICVISRNEIVQCDACVMLSAASTRGFYAHALLLVHQYHRVSDLASAKLRTHTYPGTPATTSSPAARAASYSSRTERKTSIVARASSSYCQLTIAWRRTGQCSPHWISRLSTSFAIVRSAGYYPSFVTPTRSRRG